jgi:hypothetical protein
MMSKHGIVILFLILISITLSGCTLPFFKAKYAGIQIQSNPQAGAYLNGKYVGPTTYKDDKLKPEEYLVKLVPLVTTLPEWETKVKLQAGTIMIINRDFGASPAESSSYIVQTEKLSNKKSAELTIVTTPENVVVRLDDQPKGLSPLTNLGVTPGNHKVTLSTNGYKTLDINIRAEAGQRVLLTAELGKVLALQPLATPSATASVSATPVPSSPSASVKPSPSPSGKPSPSPIASPTVKPSPKAIPAKPYIEILPTPTGWLRVRSEPNGLADNELAKVYPGDMFPFIETNDAGWYKIEYTPGKQGWIAATYAKVVK